MAEDVVTILIEADDHASEQLRKSSDDFAKQQKRGESLFQASQSAADRYGDQLKELNELFAAGAISQDKYNAAAGALKSKIADATSNLNNQTAAFREHAGKAKASVEVIGALGTAFGSSELGAIAGQVGGLTDKMSAFSEVSKSGGAGAFAFKAGLVAAAGAIGLQVGQAIGGALWQTERWKEELEGARKAAEKLDNQLAKHAMRQSQQRENAIEIARTDAERNEAIQEQIRALDVALERENAMLDVSKLTLEESTKRRNAWTVDATLFRTNVKELEEQSKAEVESTRERITGLREEKNALVDLISEEALAKEAALKRNEALNQSESYITGLREQVELLKASEEERYALEAKQAGAFEGDNEEAIRLMKEIDLIQEKKRAEDEAAKARIQAAEQAQAAEQQRIDSAQSIVDGLRQQVIEMELGAEAAKVYALQQQGLSEEMAMQVAALEQSLKGTPGGEKNTPVGSLAASDTRLLTDGGSKIDPVADNTKKTAEQTKRANELLSKLDEGIRQLNSSLSGKGAVFVESGV